MSEWERFELFIWVSVLSIISYALIAAYMGWPL